mmetsp:Transcript_12255/g.23259  ORF Transcript_12255/g.23259 Transcript_12255/m.23259 type:complete len:450 (+) Transcript_12255:1108-2457(+)|eukprot:CAMPEP_0204899132 /NCGR_PEP_ID=MMETSP1397-20131031/1677_1 /ASSEMBLY_ACC=CAM_ASM_000891 /TAXON_ID=49980 /ORGANISM="Climacostomum Climacostomum virens, Strain Stock W-24" /LENGTH=449 /DNA_ID=CAMNT_0052067049 /DNA_START=1052 /DNA_END=2401 /DNA_ORIENTATION=-
MANRMLEERDRKMKELRDLRTKVKLRSTDPSPASISEFKELEPIEEIKVLTSEVKRRKQQAEEARRNCIRAEVDAQSAKQKAALLEEEVARLRAELRQADTRQVDTEGQQEQIKLHQELRQAHEQINSLKQQLQQAKDEKKRQGERINEVWAEVERLKHNLDTHRSVHSDERHVRDDTEHWLREKESLLEDLKKSRITIENLMKELRDRDEAIMILERDLVEETRERVNLNEILLSNFAMSSQPAEPPPETTVRYSPIIVDILPQGGPRRQIVSDVGSTGTSFPKRQREESKEVHYASPDPLENLLHQSTGETIQDNKEFEAATPPHENPWGEPSPQLGSSLTPTIHLDFEEEEKAGTPKRDEALSGRASRSSTPPRHYDKPSSPAPQQNVNLRAHQQPSHSQQSHYPSASTNPFQGSGDTGDDFFDMMAYDPEPRRVKYGAVPKTLFD